MPGKNLMKIGGKTLIERAIESARDCLYVDAPVVSSDDDAILAEAVRLNVINHRRAEFASNDEASAADVVTDFLTGDE